MSKIRTFLVTSNFVAPKCFPLVWKNFLIHTNIAQTPDMTCLEERKIGAIVGALVADAAGKLCPNLVHNMCRFPGIFYKLVSNIKTVQKIIVTPHVILKIYKVYPYTIV